MTDRKQFKTVDEYIKFHPKDLQDILEKVRHIIHKAVPEAKEAISYGIPVFKLNDKYVIYFAGYKNHISIYPIPPLNPHLQKEVAQYIAGKGTLKFPLNKPVPYDLIKKLVPIFVKANQER